MPEPYVTTDLVRDQPLQEQYSGASGSTEADADYQSFLKEFNENEGLPVGEYSVTGIADFIIDQEPSKSYEISSEISFIVREGLE